MKLILNIDSVGPHETEFKWLHTNGEEAVQTSPSRSISVIPKPSRDSTAYGRRGWVNI